MSTKRGRYGNPKNRRPISVGDLIKRAQPTGVADPTSIGGSMSGPGGPHDRNAVVLDMTDALLMSGFSVAEVEVARQGAWDGRVAFMQIEGRVNKTTRTATVGVLGNSDAIAAMITELLALAARSGPDYLDDITRRLTALHQGKSVDLHWLRAAVDNAIELAEQEP